MAAHSGWLELLGAKIDHAWYYNDDITLDKMGLDHAGHEFGGHSSEYLEHAREFGEELKIWLDRWCKHVPNGIVIIDSDHGQTAHGHGGTSAQELNVFYYALVPVLPVYWPSSQRQLRAFLQSLLPSQ